MEPVRMGAVAAPLYYVRCRIDRGRYDAAPVLRDVAFKAVSAVQRVPAATTFVIAANCTITYAPTGAPKPMDQSPVRIQLDAAGRITELDFTAHAKTDPQFTVLDFLAPAGKNDGG